MMAMVVVNDVKYDRDCKSNYLTIIPMTMTMTMTMTNTDYLSQHLALTKSSFTTREFLGTPHHHKTHQRQKFILTSRSVLYSKCMVTVLLAGNKTSS